eukprot:CAMPEP_0206455552 /NCGR_PEP_ID=MMETSP0324_2-20121206/21823_1 /ASSEMBLY_ACC=CAM_ASM_000836 /TAXON_ID=2866 /ORGANISM="Crypthecodinium cohnii, Strain Seligo" /LENGTH=64 /DNA_ID=CAMNT_0053926283 /DNA_START=262 /DNA_END=453 /DNA_ORIENTATION=+
MNVATHVVVYCCGVFQIDLSGKESLLGEGPYRQEEGQQVSAEAGVEFDPTTDERDMMCKETLLA